MGLEFGSMTEEAKGRLQAYLDRMDPSISAAAHKPSE
jgi:hypothetical protein